MCPPSHSYGHDAPWLIDEIVRHVLDGCEIGWCVIGAHTAFIVAQHHVHDPVETVLDGPVASYDCAQLLGGPLERRDIEAGLVG